MRRLKHIIPLALIVLVAACAEITPAPITPRSSLRDCSECPEMVVMPAGWFMMGSNRAPDEKPIHRVTIGEPFAVGRYEVTFDPGDPWVTLDLRLFQRIAV